MSVPLPSIVEDELLRYGYGLSPERQILFPASRFGARHPGRRTTGVTLSIKRHRLSARTEMGTLLWSGPPEGVSDFLERFWLAKPLWAGGAQ